MNQETKHRVFVIGFDGATLDLLEPWAQAGLLPTFQRLMTEGSYGPLRSTLPPMTAPAWTSFMTGKNPGRHGLIDWIRRDEAAYTASPTSGATCTEPTLWSILSRRGRRVCVFNVPMTYPPTPVNGVLIAGLPAPNKHVPLTYPPELQAELDDLAGGDYLLYPDPGQAYSTSGVEAFLQRLYATTRSRLRVLEALRRRADWDFLMVVFNGTDTIQHALWRFMDDRHPLHDPVLGQKFGQAILQFYQHLDNWLADLLPTLELDTLVLGMSDHGFGPFHKFIHVNRWLLQEGFLALQQTPRARAKAWLFERGFAPMPVYNWLMRLGFGALKREVVRGQGQGLLKTLFLSFDEVDWARTQAYALGNIGQIYLNVQGREPLGCVTPGAEYLRVREAIMRRLGELRDPATGEKVVEAVYPREALYQGAQVERLPDIVFLPTRLEYFGFGEFEFGSPHVIESMQRGISGTHRMNGLFLAWGPSVKPGSRPVEAGLIDLAPTILHALGEAVPTDMDGRVLHEVFTGALADPALVRRCAPDEAQAGNSAEFSSADADALRDRLRGLGYVGFN